MNTNHRLILLFLFVVLSQISFGQLTMGLQFNSEKYSDYEGSSNEDDGDSPRNLQIYPSAVVSYKFNPYNSIAFDLGFYSNRHEFVQTYSNHYGGGSRYTISHSDIRVNLFKPAISMKVYFIKDKLYVGFGVGASYLHGLNYKKSYSEEWRYYHYYPPQSTVEDSVVEEYSVHEFGNGALGAKQFVLSTNIRVGYQQRITKLIGIYGELGMGFGKNQWSYAYCQDGGTVSYNYSSSYERSSKMNKEMLQSFSVKVGLTYSFQKKK